MKHPAISRDDAALVWAVEFSHVFEQELDEVAHARALRQGMDENVMGMREGAEGSEVRGAEGSHGRGAEGSKVRGSEGSKDQGAEGPKDQGAEGPKDQGAVDEGPGDAEVGPEDRDAALFARAQDAQLFGVAFSGGGIRSATFNLGVLQALAELKLIARVDYLSTVSGGGYIASWFIAWVKRAGLHDVARHLCADWRNQRATGATGATGATTATKTTLMAPLTVGASALGVAHGAGDPGAGKPVGPEPTAIRFLRQYSNYLTPRLGWFGADTWTVVSIYLRNLLLNLLILIIALATILVMPRMLASAAIWFRGHLELSHVIVVRAFVAILQIAAMYSIAKYLEAVASNSASDKPWFGSQLSVQMWIIVPMILASLLDAFTAWFIGYHKHIGTPGVDKYMPEVWTFVVGGVIYALFWIIAFGALIFVQWLRRSGPRWMRSNGDVPDRVSAFRKRSVVGWSLLTGLFAGLFAYTAFKIGLTWSETSNDVSVWPAITWGPPLMILAFTLTLIIHIGLMGRTLHDSLREWLSRMGAWLLIVSLAWIAVCATAVYGPPAVLALQAVAAMLGTGWVISTIGGIIAGRSARTGNAEGNRVVEYAAMIAPYVFILGLMLGLAVLVDIAVPSIATVFDDTVRNRMDSLAALPADSIRANATYEQMTRGGAAFVDSSLAEASVTDVARISFQQMSVTIGGIATFVAFAVFALAALALSFRVDINQFSMHLLYRNRLVRAYLGATNRRRRAQTFTGFDANDDIELSELRRHRHIAMCVVDKGKDYSHGPINAPPPESAFVFSNGLTNGADSQVFWIEGSPGQSIYVRVDQTASTQVDEFFGSGKCRYGAAGGRWKRFPSDSWRSGMHSRFAVAVRIPDCPGERSYVQVLVDQKGLAPDSIEVSATYVDESDNDAPQYHGPYPIINTAMNLVGGDELAWQMRKATSFVLTPLFCGFEVAGGAAETNELQKSGYCRTSGYARISSGVMRTANYIDNPLTLGTAMSISGAAASPNMGYHTSTPLAFLMTVFNVRLGWWLGNPRHKKWEKSGPRSLLWLLSELFGLTDDKRAYVYLSDGGHFENLGIYELVRRRCRFIIASDAGADREFAFTDLGNAVEKCRSDLGIDIEIDMSRIRRVADSEFSGSHCAVGRIRYDRIDPNAPVGTLVYFKASLTGDEPTDVLRYSDAHESFPHESTADQFFDESQFESYRALGYHIASSTLSVGGGAKAVHAYGSEELFVRLRHYWYPPNAAVQAAFTRHTQALAGIYERMRNDRNARYLDSQIYPEWSELLAGYRRNFENWDVDVMLKSSPFTIPRTYAEMRSGFYLCNSMLQLMEDVYLDLNLEREYGHPDNRGWMNLFKHWSWSGTMQASWTICASTYGVRFQEFCERHLGMKLGRAHIETLRRLLLKDSVVQVDQNQSIMEMLARTDVQQRVIGMGWLNEIEITIALKFARDAEKQGVISSGPSDPRPFGPYPITDLYLLRLSTRHAEAVDETIAAHLEFTFGFALCSKVDGMVNVLHFRVQDHLRQMGLARMGLRALMESLRGTDTKMMSTLALLDKRVSLNDASNRRKFEQLFHSVQYELRAEREKAKMNTDGRGQ